MYAPQNFVDGQGPAISAAFLNGLDVTVNFALQGATTLTQLQTILGVPSGLTPLPIGTGGTGQITAPLALAALGGTTLTAAMAATLAAINQAFLASTLAPQTPNETAVFAALGFGAVVNFLRPPADVDRYVSNAIPGTTDTTNAWQIAVAVAKLGGNGNDVTYGFTTLYLVTGPINCTTVGAPNAPGFIVRGLSNMGQDANFGVLARHNGNAVFDCTGNDGIEFRDVTIKTDAVTYPLTGILTARNSSLESNLIRLDNVKIVGKFGVACYYNYASEDDDLNNCYFANYATTPATKCAVWTSNNIFALSSPFVTMATGSHSCIDHTVEGCQFFNASGNSVETDDCIYLEAIENLHLFGGWAYNAGPIIVPATGTATASAAAGVMTVTGSFTGVLATGMQVNGTGIPMGTVIVSLGTGTGNTGTYNIASGNGVTTWGAAAINAGYPGRALIYVDMTNGPSNGCQIIGLAGEVAAPLQNYGILFSNHAQTPQNWTVDGCKLPNAGFAIASGPLTGGANGVSALFVRNIFIQQGYGIAIPGTLMDSRIDAGAGCPLTIGVSKRNLLVGDTSAFAVTTRTADAWMETGQTNRTFAPGLANAANGWTFTGAITQSASLDYVGNEARFTIQLAGATNVTAAAGATIALPFTVTRGSVATVSDTVGVALGYATINGSTLTLPAGFTVNTHTIYIQGMGFVS